MRLSKQLCFLVAAAIASAVDGAPIGDKLQRRQAITLELTPTQQVDVDGSREMPTILISDNGYQVGQTSNCMGSNCNSYPINMPPVKQMQDYMVPQTHYDPYVENYSPYPTYPPSRSSLYAPPPVQSQVINGGGSAQSLPVVNEAPKWTNAGWNAPLIPSGTFADSLQSTPSVSSSIAPTSSTTSTTLPGPVPGAVPQVQNLAPAYLSKAQSVAATPLPLTAPNSATIGASPTSVPPLAPDVEVKDEKKAEVKPGEAPPPATGTPSEPEVKTITNEAAIASNREQTESKPAPPAPAPAPAPQRRGLRSGQTKKASSSSSAIKKRTLPKRLQKRQVELVEKPATSEMIQSQIAPIDCEPTRVEKVEVLVPVTEEELTALQDGFAEIVSYPSVGPDGKEEKLYDVLPTKPEPTLTVPTLNNIYEDGIQKISAAAVPITETEATSVVTPVERSLDENSEASAFKSRSLNVGSQDTPIFPTLEKRLKYGSNGFNASMVGNGAGKTKYGFTIHDNKNGASSSISPISVCTTMALAAIFGVYATLL